MVNNTPFYPKQLGALLSGRSISFSVASSPTPTWNTPPPGTSKVSGNTTCESIHHIPTKLGGKCPNWKAKSHQRYTTGPVKSTDPSHPGHDFSSVFVGKNLLSSYYLHGTKPGFWIFWGACHAWDPPHSKKNTRPRIFMWEVGDRSCTFLKKHVIFQPWKNRSF